MQRYMKLLIRFFLTLAICLCSNKVIAESLPIGITLNQSSAGAQHAIDFKNGIEAYFSSINSSGRLGKYELKLIAMDDTDKKERAVSNVKRLISSKKALAVLSNHTGETQAALTELAVKKNFLLLSSSSTHIEVPSYAQKYIGYLNIDNKKHLENAMPLLSKAKNIYLLLEDKKQQNELGKYISTLIDPTVTQVSPLALESIDNTGVAKNKDTLFIIGDSFIYSSLALKLLNKDGNNQANFLIMPDAGASLVAMSISKDKSFDAFEQLYFMNSVPLHLKNLPIVKEFERDLKAYNSQANKSHQALKGYILAHILSRGVYRAVKNIKTDSVKDFITLPFQVLDKVVGWVSHAGDSINKDIMVDSLLRSYRFDYGLDKEVNFGKNRVLFDQSWVTKSSKRSSFFQVPSLSHNK